MEILSLISVAIAFAMLFFHTFQSADLALVSEGETATPRHKPTPITYDAAALHFIAWAEIELAKRARAETVASSADTVKALPTPPQAAVRSTLRMYGTPIVQTEPPARADLSEHYKLAHAIAPIWWLSSKTCKNGAILVRFWRYHADGTRTTHASFMPKTIGQDRESIQAWLANG